MKIQISDLGPRSPLDPTIDEFVADLLAAAAALRQEPLPDQERHDGQA